MSLVIGRSPISAAAAVLLIPVLAVAASGGSWTTIASKQLRPCAPKVDGEFVYWGTADGLILRASKTAKEPVPVKLAKLSGAVRAIALAGRSLYASVASDDGASVVRIAKAGGSPRTLARDLPLVDSTLAADGKSVYWGTGGALWRASIQGGRAVKLAESPEFFPADLACEGNWLYWSNSSDDNAGVWRVSKDGGAAVQVAGTGFDEVASFAVAPPWLYFALRGEVRRILLERGEDEKSERVAEGLEVRRSGTSIVIAAESGGMSSRAIDGGAAATLFEKHGDLDFTTLAADPAGLYLATAAAASGDGLASILRFAPY